MDGFSVPAGTTYRELIATIFRLDGGALTVDDEWREPTPVEMAAYRAELRDYARRRREGWLYEDEEPPCRPVAHWVRVYSYSR